LLKKKSGKFPFAIVLKIWLQQVSPGPIPGLYCEWGDMEEKGITRAKCTGGMTQEVECLVCKREAPSSNPSPTKKKMAGGVD
jgi:hypothetical protein